MAENTPYIFYLTLKAWQMRKGWFGQELLEHTDCEQAV